MTSVIAASGRVIVRATPKLRSVASSTATTALTKAQFVARANAICTTGNNQIAAADAKLSKNPTKAQITAVVKTTTAPSIQAQINGIRALGAPSGDQATVTNMLNLAQADLNKVKSNPASLATGGASPFADFAKVAKTYGERKGIAYATWREMGVSSEVLARSGITRGA